MEDLQQQLKAHHRQFLELLMGYERQGFLNAQPYQRTQAQFDQATGFDPTPHPQSPASSILQRGLQTCASGAIVGWFVE